MTGIIEWLQGRKTWIILILAFVFNAGVMAGWWSPESEWWTLINTILGFLGIGTIGAKITRTTKKQ